MKLKLLLVAMLGLCLLAFAACGDDDDNGSASETIDLMGNTYRYGSSADIGDEIGDTGIYYTLESGEALAGTLYGVASMTYAEYYYAELMASDDGNTVTEANPSDVLDTDELYDAISSATSLTGTHSTEYPEIINYTPGTDLETDPMTIDGISTVDVAIDAELYVQGTILNEAATGQYALGKTVGNILINDDAGAPIYGNNVKTVMADGSYGTANDISGTIEASEALVDVGDFEVSTTVSYDYAYGDCGLSVSFTNLQTDDDTAVNYLGAYMNVIYAVTYENEDGVVAGTVFYEDTWHEVHHGGIDIALTNGDFEAHGYEFTSERVVDYFDEVDTRTIRPGTYTITVKARGYEDAVGTFTFGTTLGDEEVLVGGEAELTESGASIVLDTSALPEDFEAESWSVTKGRRTSLEEGTDFSYDTATQTLTFLSSETVVPGEYVVALTDPDYQPAEADILLKSTITQSDITLTDGVFAIDGDIDKGNDYADNVEKVTVTADGEVEGIEVETGRRSDFFSEDDDGNKSINPEATSNDEALFESGQTYTLVVEAVGYDTFTFTYTAP